MKHRIVHLTLYLVPLVLAQAKAEVKLEVAQRENLDIQTSTLNVAHVPRTYSATAQVLDAAPLVALLRDLRAAQSAASASHNELDRAEQLHAADANVSSKTLEATRAQSLADAGRADTLRAQLLTAWGPALLTMKENARESLIAAVLENRAVLIRAESRNTDRAQIRAGKVRLLAGDESLQAEVLGLAAGNAQTVGRSYLLRVDSTSLQPGQVLDAELQDAQQALTGVIVPRSAITRWQGDNWVYVETEPNHFTRKAIHPVSWLDDGCLVQKELEVGQRIVVTGATMLLGVENAPASED